MRLTTEYLGLVLPHPFVPGASPLTGSLDGLRALEDAGAPALVLPSLFEEQFDGAPPVHFRLDPERYLALVHAARGAVAVPVIASLNGLTTRGWVSRARQLEQAGASALELNFYGVGADPQELGSDLEERFLELMLAVRAQVRLPIAVKLTPYFSSLSNLAARLERAGATGLVLFNRLYQPELDLETMKVTQTLRTSDASELPLRLRWLGVLSAQVGCSLAASGGVHQVEDAVRALALGADVVQVVSVLLEQGPGALRGLREGLERWLEGHGFESLGQLHASMNYEAVADPSAWLRTQYLAQLQHPATAGSR